jgi:hypothetical protein
MTLLFLDTETTGLDPAKHEVWELAYAIGDGPVHTYVLRHNLATADLQALAVNGYHERSRKQPLAATVELEVRTSFAGTTLVGANPRFDAAFLSARWGVEPWKYRLLDIEAYAMGVLGLDEVLGLRKIAEMLDSDGFAIPKPDHSAARDVVCLRAVYKALRETSELRRFAL